MGANPFAHATVASMLDAVAPGEIEAFLMSPPDVAQALVDFGSSAR